jgi:hypothetical protein
MKKKSASDLLDDIYTKIPTMVCEPDCSECCTVVLMSKTEWNRITDKRIATTIKCPYSINSRCEIYDQRPFVCRIIGATEDAKMKCPKGCHADRPMTTAETNKLADIYSKIIKKEGAVGPHIGLLNNLRGRLKASMRPKKGEVRILSDGDHRQVDGQME